MMTKYAGAAPPRHLHTQNTPPFPSQHHSYTVDNEGKKGSLTMLATKTKQGSIFFAPVRVGYKTRINIAQTAIT
eukprot:4694752-Ditylum_brightwellii.AAC.1